MRISLFTLFTLFFLIHPIISGPNKGNEGQHKVKSVTTSTKEEKHTKVKSFESDGLPPIPVKADFITTEENQSKDQSTASTGSDNEPGSSTEGPSSDTTDGLRQGGLKSDDLEGLEVNGLEDKGLEENDSEKEVNLKNNSEDDDDDDCGPNEVFTKCGNQCKESLAHVKRGRACPPVCRKGCFCAQGYFRDGFGNCNQAKDKYIRDLFAGQTKKAKRFRCLRPNEKYVECGDRCVESIINIYNYTHCKPYQCRRGCYCVDGYMRLAETNGVCVPAKRPKLKDEDDDDDDDDDKEKDKKGSRDNHGDDDDQNEDNKNKRDQPNSGLRQGGLKHNDLEGLENKNEQDEDSPVDEEDSQGNHGINTGLRQGGLKPSDVEGLGKKGKESPEDEEEDNEEEEERRPNVPIQRPFPQRRPPIRSCGRRETYSDCGNRCLESFQSNWRECDPNKCDVGCFCKPGLFRNKFGVCAWIRYGTAPRQVVSKPAFCPPNEAFSKCGNRCMESLENRIFQRIKCDPEHCNVGCFCLPPLYRNRRGHCVPLRSASHIRSVGY